MSARKGSRHYVRTVGLAVILTATACGSTASRGDGDASGLGAGAANSETSSLDSGALPDASSTEVVGAPAADGTPASPAAGAQSTRAPTGAAAPTTAAPTDTKAGSVNLIPAGRGVRGVTDSTILVGLWYYNPGSAGVAIDAVGGAGSTYSAIFPQPKDIQKLVDHINANGGVAGRKLEAVYAGVDAAKANTRSGRDQEGQFLCSSFTEDRQVFGMVAMPSDVVRECVLRNRVVVWEEANLRQPISESIMAKGFQDLWYAPTGRAAERRGRNLVDALGEQGFFKDAKVGILIWDEQSAKDGVKKGMLPALARLGIKEEQVTQILYPDGNEAPWQNYILQLQRDGVTHILWSQDGLPSNGVAAAMRAAENQRYYPRWGLDSSQQLSGVRVLGAPRTQLANVQGIGWFPVGDGVDTSADPFNSSRSPTGATCRKLVEEGVPAGVVFYCEGLFLLQHALGRATEISPAGLSAALDKVGDSYRSMWTIDASASFSRQNHFGPSIYRDLAYNEGCGETGQPCFKYTSPPKTFGP